MATPGGGTVSRTWWRKWRSGTSKNQRERCRASSRPGVAFRPHVELLESRTVPSWIVVAPMLTPRSGLAAVEGSDRMIYAIGGTDATGTPLATVEMYNPTTNAWRTATPLPMPVTGLAAATGADGRIYVVGGTGSSGLTTVVEALAPS